jgi:predicted nucleic acid-binding protein
MPAVFVDTNIFLRHLLNDDLTRSPACRDLFRAIEQGSVSAWTSPLVISEIVFILSNPRTYGVSRADIRDRLLPLIGLSGLGVVQKRLYPGIFDIYVSLPIDYVDAYHAALLTSQNQDTLYSYDTDFDSVLGITRREP